MLIDFQSGVDVGKFEAQVIIAGSGPAGLSVALQLLDTDTRVIVLEAGGLEYSADSQDLYIGEQLDNFGYTFPLEDARLRYFGGSSGHWGGWCQPLHRSDFEAKAYVPYSGWPIGYDDLAPYLKDACEILDLGPPHFDSESLPFPKALAPAFDPNKITLRPWRFSPPTRFNEKYLKTFADSENVVVLYHANVTNLLLSSDLNRVISLEIRDYAEKRARLTAEHFVIAFGGIETPRFLLNCRDQVSVGIGNQHDVVGRFWMEHVSVTSAEIVAGQNARLLATTVDPSNDGDVEILNGFCVADKLRKREGILNHSATVMREFLWHRTPGLNAFFRAKRDLQRGEVSRLADHLWNILRDFDTFTEGVAVKLGLLQAADVLYVKTRSEQSPNPDSRVTLADQKDRFGHNRVRLDWRLSELDHRTIRIASHALAEELGRLGIGRLRILSWLEPENFGTWGIDISDFGHHLGGTRMSDNPKQGVVGKDCRVHGLANLYIASSSVFTTGGYVNPTLTIVQLALRLGDHLKARLRR